MVKYNKSELQKIIPILRFGSSRPENTKYRWLTYTQIARLINLSITNVRQRCLDFEKKWN